MEIKIKPLITVIIIYMYLPLLIFFAGWLKPMIAVIAIVAMSFAVIRGLCSWFSEKPQSVYVTKGMIIGAIIFILFMCCLAGTGAFTEQTWDWNKHNAVLRDLMEQPWPVCYTNDYATAMLSYYIGYYLLPAVTGKAFHSFRAAEITQFICMAAGLLLVFFAVLHLCKAEGKKKQLLCLVSLFLFGGMLVLGQAVGGSLYPDGFPWGSHEWMNPEAVRIQYTANWSLLKWVPGQTLVPWLATALLLMKPKKVETYVMVGLPVLMYSGFAMIGITVIMAAFLLYYSYEGIKNKNREERFFPFKMFSLSNILLVLSAGSILILYFCGNLLGTKPDNLKLHFLNYGNMKIFYFIFCFFMFGCYAIIIWRKNKKNMVYWTVVVSLCLYPLFSMGLQNDFTMRASIPALFALMILCMRFLFEERGETVRKTLLAVTLAIGMLSPLLNIREEIALYNKDGIHRRDDFITLEQYADPLNPEIPDDMKYNYYSYDLDKDLFYRYLAK